MSCEVIKPLELKALIDSKASLLLIDVREPEEFELVHLSDAILIPLMEVEGRLEEIKEFCNKGYEEIVVYCRGGTRSEFAIEQLHSLGLEFPFKNLLGGINAYATEADNSLEPY